MAAPHLVQSLAWSPLGTAPSLRVCLTPATSPELLHQDVPQAGHTQHGQTCLSVSRHRPSVQIRTTSAPAPTPSPSDGPSIPRPPPLPGLLPSLRNRSTDCFLISGRAEPASFPHQPLLQHPAAPEDGISQLPLQLSAARACAWQFICADSQVQLPDSPGQGRPPGAVGPALGSQSRQRGGRPQQPHGEELLFQSRLLSEKEIFIC